MAGNMWNSREKSDGKLVNCGPLIIAYGGVAALVITIGGYSYFFPGDVLADHARWGQFGDYIGGAYDTPLLL
jgi:hypothetical protein